MADRHFIPVQPVAGAYEHGVILSGLQVVEEAFPLMEEGMHIAKRMIARLEMHVLRRDGRREHERGNDEMAE